MDPQHLIMTWGHPAIFAAVLSEFLGLPVPSALALAAAAALPESSFSAPGLIAIGTTAALIGDSIWYWAGRKRGNSLIGLYCTVSLGSASCTSKTKASFKNLGPRSLVAAKFVPGLSTFAAPMAGLLQIPYPVFLFWDFIGSTLWAGAFVLVGRTFAITALAQIQGGVELWGLRILLPAAACAALYIGMKWLKRFRQGPANAEQIHASQT